MSTLILRISKRKVPLLERLHLLYPLSRIGTPFRSGTVHPLLVAPASSPPAGADSFSGTNSPLAISACAYRKPARAGIHPNTSSTDSSTFPQHRATPPSWPRQPAHLRPLLRLRHQKTAMPPGPTRTASLRAKPFRKRGLMPSCRTCARTGCCSSQASFPRYRCRSRPVGR